MTNIIFDFNGTLFQDTQMHREAWGRFMARHGVELTDDDFYKYMCGPPNDAILRRFLRPDLTDDEVVALAAEKEAFYHATVLSDPALQQLTDGAPELLDRLRARGIPYAIATGSAKDNVDFYMDTLHIDRWFDYDHVFYAERHLPGKPDPTIYRLAMEKLGFRPEDTLVVEDALAGIRSAVGAGVRRVVAIDTTLGPDAFGGIPEVVGVIHDFTDFDRFLP